MPTRSGVLFSTVLAMLLLAASATAADPSWQTGLDAFENSDFEVALEIFETLRDAGLDGPAVHYNIGVCEYRTRRYRSAEATFTFIRDRYPKLAGLADYNLGLVTRRLGLPEQALSHFQHAYDASADDQTLRTMAAEMIFRLTPEPVSNKPGGYASFGVRAGYDDNVALRDELGLPAGTTFESPLLDAYLTGDLPLTAGGHVRLDGIAYAVRYFDTPEYDQNVAEGGLLLRREHGPWQFEASARGNYGTLDGDAFDRGLSLDATVRRRIGDAASIRLSIEHADISAAADVYSGIDGTRERVQARYRWGSESRTLVATLQFESNDRIDAGGSPDRLGARVSWRYHAGDTWSYAVDAGWRNSDYARLPENRSERRGTLGLGATRSIGKGWMVSLFYEYARNESSDPAFSYNRNRMTVGIQRVF